MPAKNLSFILDISRVSQDDQLLVGDKGASLGEITSLGLPVPPGAIVTTRAYRYFLKENGLKTKINQLLESSSLKKPEELQEISDQIRKLILRASMPEDLAWQIIKAYTSLGRLTNPPVAIRSSAIGEDLQSSFLNVSGEANVIKKVQECWASLFEARGIFYRQEAKKNLFGRGIAVVIQKMIQAEAAGVLFTADPTGNKKNTLIIEAIWGLGEYLVQGRVTPDQYLVNSQTGKIIDKKIRSQRVYLLRKGGKNVKGLVAKKKASLPKLNDEEIKRLADLAKKIHRYYFFPQEIEWAKVKNQFFILQTRPLTTASRPKSAQRPPGPKGLPKSQPPILEGISASPGIVSGPVKKIKSAKEIKKINLGDILVAPLTTPDFIPAMRLIGGIITDQGGQTSHAAIISRELSLPCIVGTKTATKDLKNGQLITVDANRGEVFLGKKTKKRPKNKTETDPQKLAQTKTATKVYINLSEPEVAKIIAQGPADGVGLLRAEFMLAKIGHHPRALLEKKQEKIITQELTSGLEKICRAFSPRPVVYRASDFKTNEYRHLSGGEKYEAREENPLLGFRGASRYIADSQIFALELKAIKNVRNKRGWKNLWLSIPFVRTPNELIEVKKIIAAHGLSRGPSFKLWLMVETPANVINLKNFIEAGIDGVSLGTNDLTMLMLGIDRDNAKLNKLFDGLDPAVLWAIKKTIKICQRHQITSSICGQVVSDQPEIISKLVNWGISSISVNPDTIEAAKIAVIQAEKEIINHG